MGWLVLTWVMLIAALIGAVTIGVCLVRKC